MNLKNKKLIVKSPAKINLHLEVLGKRDDGYHELAMIMQSIDLSDYLEMEVNSQNSLILDSNSDELCSNEDNLIIKAANKLKKYSQKKELGANIFLKKNIPVGAGLAGGSSNAAATLVGLNKLWNLNYNTNLIHNIASEIGSDVPFFINGGSQYCFGRGEILEKYDFNHQYGLILLKNPKVSVSTAEVYKKYSKIYLTSNTLSNKKIDEKRNNLKSMGFQNKNIFHSKIQIKNDLQRIVECEVKSVSDSLNILSEIKDKLCFSMSGSGPTCFAVVDNYENAKAIYNENKEMFSNFGLDSWICNFYNRGVTII